MMSRKLMKESSFDFHALPWARFSETTPKSVILRIDRELNNAHVPLRLDVHDPRMRPFGLDLHRNIQPEIETSFPLVAITDAFIIRRTRERLQF